MKGFVIEMNVDYLILVNSTHPIPRDYVNALELVPVEGYDREVYLVEKNAAEP